MFYIIIYIFLHYYCYYFQVIVEENGHKNAELKWIY